MNKYTSRLNHLIDRRVMKGALYAEVYKLDKEFSYEGYTLENELLESITKSKDSEILKYVNEACNEVDKRYTEKSFSEGKRIQNQLNKVLDNVCYKYQGSLSNNTHIKASSDIDLLVLLEKYILNSKKEIKDLKDECDNHLQLSFPKVNVTRGSKTIKLKGGSLSREIDVVPSHWDSNEDFRKPVCILDEDSDDIHTNTPFYHNQLLESKDLESEGYFKKGVRLLKNIKVDLEKDINKELKISSYEIVAFLYLIDFCIPKGFSNRALVPFLVKSLNNILKMNNLFDLQVPDKSRKIIRNNQILDDLKLLINELKGIESELVKDENKGLQFSLLAATPKAWGDE
ncbi:hypothetical protein [Cetobacterium sp.]|uniref:hypothetical protein n=1 Tax=Cetobacterium sp. TaxID=2071632 RepID=UPI003F2AF7FB